MYIKKNRYVKRQNLSKRYEEYMLRCMLPAPLLQPNETDPLPRRCDDPRGRPRRRQENETYWRGVLTRSALAEVCSRGTPRPDVRDEGKMPKLGWRAQNATQQGAGGSAELRLCENDL